MNLWKKIAGATEMEITSADPEGLLRAINAAGIEIQNIQYVSELTYQIVVWRWDCKRIIHVCRERGDEAAIRQHNGLLWEMLRGVGRPILLAGILILFMTTSFLQNRILFVRVFGAELVPEQRIIDVAQRCGIYFCASRRQVRSEQVKNALISSVPELQWAGVNTAGCVAEISVRERIKEEPENDEAKVSNIVANKDGHILWVEAEEGSVLIQSGEAVKLGQTLISGYVDCGTHVRVGRAKGEVYAQTKRPVTAIMLSEQEKKVLQTEIQKKYSVLIGKKRINFWKDSGILEGSCGRMYEEYYITLPGGFSLPIALCVDSYQVYETQPVSVLPEDAERAMSVYAKRHVIGQTIAGTISEESYSITEINGLFRLDGNYICTEMIGRERQEKIGDTNGENS